MKFVAKMKMAKNAAPFPSAVIVFDGKQDESPSIKKITRKGILTN